MNVRKYLLPHTQQYKVNLHAHTVISDGHMTPEEIKAYYQKNGYHAVAFTDHEVLIPHNDLTDDTFVALVGYEYSIPLGEKGPMRRYYHLNFLSRTPDVRTHVFFHPNAVWGNARNYLPAVEYKGEYVERVYATEFVNRLIREAHAEGYLVQYNHPHWSLQYYPDYEGLEGVDFLEIFNTGVNASDRLDRDDHVFDDFLWLGKFPIPTGNDDNHNGAHEGEQRWDSLGAYNMVAAEELSYEGLMSALASGATYATEGPRIHAIYAEGNKVTVACSPVAYLRVQGNGRHGYTVPVRRDVGGIEGVTVEIAPEWKYFRVILEDEHGLRAYSRAYRVEEFLV